MPKKELTREDVTSEQIGIIKQSVANHHNYLCRMANRILPELLEDGYFDKCVETSINHYLEREIPFPTEPITY